MGIGPEKFVVLYAGTIGLISGAEVMVEAAKRLESFADILFVLVGDGYAKDRVETLAKVAGLKNLYFFPFQSRQRLGEVQATADVSLVTLSPGRGKTSFPSKVLAYMAAARPVIAQVDAGCDIAELIREAKCGLVVLPAQGELLAEAILHFYKNPEDRHEAGRQGLRYFSQNLERQQILEKYQELVKKLVSEGSTETL